VKVLFHQVSFPSLYYFLFHGLSESVSHGSGEEEVTKMKNIFVRFLNFVIWFQKIFILSSKLYF